MELKYFIVCVFTAVLVACGGKAGEEVVEKAVEKKLEKKLGEDAEVDLSKGKMKVKTEDGEFAMDMSGGAKLPDGFPSDVYVYKGAKVIMSMKVPKGHMVTLQTGDKAKDVIEKYSKELGGSGWTKKTSMEMEEQHISMFQKKKRVVNVLAAPEDKGTVIRLTVSEQ